MSNITVKLAGVDISSHVDEASVEVVDTLGQGAGTGGVGAGRASTCTFLTDLGPLATAVGAGTHVTQPTLVRQGELQVYDANNVPIYGGYVTKYSDVTERTTILTKVDAVDYWQHLDRIIVNEIYVGQTDIFMIKDLLTKYAPFINQAALPTAPSFTFATKNYRHFTLQKALNDICNITGFQIWIDFVKGVHYESPVNAMAAPFQLSDSPDFRISFPCTVTSNDIDDAAATNRAIFYGGSTPSGDFLQDLSVQANGVNTVFSLAYFPHPAADGKIHLTLNGAAQVLGTAFGTGSANILKSAGGSADALIDYGAKTITWSTAPAGGASVTCLYRYQNPLVVVLTDPGSYAFYGQYLDTPIIDTSIFDKQQAIDRCRVLLQEQKYGLQTINVSTWQPGLRAGTLLQLTHSIRQINNKYIIQQVTTVPLGSGNFRYDLQLGSWNWNMVDVFVTLSRLIQPQDTSLSEPLTQLDVIQNYLNHHHTLSVTKKQSVTQKFHAHATILNDGQDAFCGYSSV